MSPQAALHVVFRVQRGIHRQGQRHVAQLRNPLALVLLHHPPPAHPIHAAQSSQSPPPGNPKIRWPVAGGQWLQWWLLAGGGWSAPVPLNIEYSSLILIFNAIPSPVLCSLPFPAFRVSPFSCFVPPSPVPRPLPLPPVFHTVEKVSTPWKNRVWFSTSAGKKVPDFPHCGKLPLHSTFLIQQDLPSTPRTDRSPHEGLPHPFHLYDEAAIRANARRLTQAFSILPGFREHFAVKAASTPFC